MFKEDTISRLLCAGPFVHLRLRRPFVPSQQGGTNEAHRSIGAELWWWCEGRWGQCFRNRLTVTLQQPAGRLRHVQQRFLKFHSHHPGRAEPSRAEPGHAKRLLSERQRSVKIPLASQRGGCVVAVCVGGRGVA